MDWQRLGTTDPTLLAAARDNAHQAAQILAAVGETHLAPRPDTSHNAMVWWEGGSALATHELPGNRPCRVMLRLGDATLILAHRQGALHREFALAGRTREEASEWVRESLAGFTDGALAAPLEAPDYELPAHPIAKGAPYVLEAVAALELARWYGNADVALGALAARTPGASAVLCWPHHFDLGALIVVACDATGAATKTLGVGFSPGDEAIPAPYFYVNHWPGRDASSLPPLHGGEWHTQGWTGAVLHGAELVAAGEAHAQEAALGRFLESALSANRALLEA